MSADSVAQDQIVAFVDRILRLKEEAKAINADIREIYAEAKGNGFDKTVLGKLVTYVEKRSSDPNQLNEAEAIFDLYLEAYDSAKGRVGTVRATHRHAPEAAHSLAAPHVGAVALSVGDVAVDMATGEIIETQPETVVQSAEPEMASAEDGRDVEAAGGAAPVLTHSNPTGTSPQSTPAGEGSGEGHPVAPLGNSAAQTASLSPDGANGANAGGENVVASDDPRTVIKPENALNARADADDLGSAVEIGARSPGDKWLERCPPAGVKRHEFSYCFPDLWGPNRADLIDDIRANGVQHPIVKMGDVILDGWARYNIARDLLIEYPVTEYAGADPLADVIRWNLASRQLSTNERKAIATKLMKLPNVAHRASEIAQLFGLETEEAA